MSARLRVWNGIIDAFGRGEIDPLLGARRKDMLGIDDERRRSGPIAPDPPRSHWRDGVNFRQGRVADGSWSPTALRRPLLALAKIRSRQMQR